MSIIKVDSRIEEYRARALSDDLNDLSGRMGRPDMTYFVSSGIAELMDPGEGDVFVDIGCGDGTLIDIIVKKNKAKEIVGILPTPEEAGRVSERFSEYENISIRTGLSTSTGLPDGYADKVVCNGVLILLDDDDFELSLREIARISKKNAHVYIGEHPFVDETVGKDYGDSILGWLMWTLKKQGIKSFVSRVKQVINAVFSKEPFVISPKEHHFCQPSEMISRASKYGLNIEDYHRHMNTETEKSNSRYDYYFIKK